MERKIIAMVSLGAILLLAGFFTELIVLDQTAWAAQSFSDSRILVPLSESLTPLNVSQPNSVLQVMVTANSTLVIEVSHDGKAEYKWEDVDFKKNVLLLNTGTWAVSILNNSTTTSCRYTSTITLKEPKLEQSIPYAWLRIPLLILGIISISLTVPAHFFDKIRSRLNKETIKTFIAVAIILMLIFSYQIGGFLLQTSTPWAVCEGLSMEPTVNFGDLVIIIGTEPQNLAPDDIILFQKIALNIGKEDFSTLSVATLHRIVYINKIGQHWYFKTKGDNNEKPDDWFVPDEGILGKVAFILPKLGYIALWLGRIEVKLFIIGIILITFFVWPQIRPKKRQTVPSSEENT
jgi:signal peptidase